MAISYPLAFPAYDYIESVRFDTANAVGISRSPYTGQQQVYDYQSGFWSVDIDLRWMNRVEAAPVIAFIDSLRGQYGTFTFGDYLTATPQGAATGTPLVNGANQTGFSLITDGWSNSTAILKKGDWIQINTALYRILNDVSSDGSGNATLDVWPHLKSHANNTAITTASCKGIFRLSRSTQVSQFIDRQKTYQISFSADEAL